MPGINLGAIGNGIGGFMAGYDRQRKADQEQQMNDLTMQMNRMKMGQAQQQQQQDQQSSALAWPGVLNLAPVGGLAGGGGLPGATPMPGQPSVPAQQPQPPQIDPAQQAYAPGLHAPAAPQPQRSEADIIARESNGNPNVGYGGVDLSDAPHGPDGFPQWAGRQGPEGPSHAAGLYQFQPGTWGPAAKALGITDFSPASQKRVYDYVRAQQGDKPWAASAGGGRSRQPMHPDQESQQTATVAANQIPSGQWGQSSVSNLAQAIEKANPDASPIVKFMALEKAAKLLAPDQKIELQTMMLNQREEFQRALRQEQHQFDLYKLQAQQNNKPEPTGTIVTGADGNQYSVRGTTASKIEGLPDGGAKRFGGAGGDKASKNIEVTDAEGKVIFKGAAHQTPDGWVNDKDQKPIQVPDDANLSISGTGGQGRQAASAINRLTVAGNEIPKALNNLVDLPIEATSGLFAGLTQEKPADLADAVKRTLANKLTSEDAQSVVVSFQGVSRSIAQIEAAGAAQGLQGLTQRADVLMPREGDTGLTVLRKYAEVRQLMEQGLEAVKASRDVGPNQIKLIDKMLADVKQAVPWTVPDVNQLQRKPDAQTVREFARSSGVGGGAGGPPQGAIDLLKQDPSLRRQFDEKYGQGAADKVLGGQ